MLGLDQTVLAYDVPQALLANAAEPLAAVQASDGVRTSTHIFAVPAAILGAPKSAFS